MTNQIVTVNVSQTIAPTPSTLQQTGAFISQGATTLAAGTFSLLTQNSDLTPLLQPATSLQSLTWTSSVVTATTTTPHGFTNGTTIQLVITGCSPTAYNGSFPATITGTTTFTYPLASNPGASTTLGSVTSASLVELQAMTTTFFAQGSATAVYVLELGTGTPAQGVTSLATFINGESPQRFYSYLVPREWAAEATFLTFLGNYEATTSMTYFFVTVTLGNYTSFTSLMKCVVGLIEAPSVVTSYTAGTVTEFSLASVFYTTLSYSPSSTNLVPPLAYAELVGVTPYPTSGNSATFTALKAAGVNWVGTGAEGGISNAILFWGTTMDLRPFNYWYSVDWVQININLDLSNEIINGSNNPLAPLYYNQNGIDRLKRRAQSTMNTGISYGLALSPVTVIAQGFFAYTKLNPSDYKIGRYAGMSVTYTPTRGFDSIVFTVNVTDFILS